MQTQIERLGAFLADPKSMIFGFVIFNLIWVWLRSPEFHFHRNIFLAMLLLVSSILILMNKIWTNLVAAIVSGYLPLEILCEFWMFPHHAEVPIFSYKHFSYFFGNIEIEDGVLIYIAATSMILSRSVFAVVRLGKQRITSPDAC